MPFSIPSEDRSSDVDDPSEISEVEEPSPEKIELTTENRKHCNQPARKSDISESDNSDCVSVGRDRSNHSLVVDPMSLGFSNEVTQCNANFFIDEITSDDEILTFQCPQNFNVNSLLNKTLDMKKPVTLSDNEGQEFSYQICNAFVNTMTCVVPRRSRKGEENGEVVKVPAAGHLVIKRICKVSEKRQKSHNDTQIVIPPIPETVMRHPILGQDWDNHVSHVKKLLKRHRKAERRLLKHEKNLKKVVQEKEERKRKLKDELSLLKKKIKLELDSS